MGQNLQGPNFSSCSNLLPVCQGVSAPGSGGRGWGWGTFEKSWGLQSEVERHVHWFRLLDFLGNTSQLNKLFFLKVQCSFFRKKLLRLWCSFDDAQYLFLSYRKLCPSYMYNMGDTKTLVLAAAWEGKPRETFKRPHLFSLPFSIPQVWTWLLDNVTAPFITQHTPRSLGTSHNITR